MVVTSKVGQCGAFITPSPEQGSPVADGWHVVQVFSGKEQKVCDDLRDAGWQAYSPMEVKWRKPSAHETPARLQRLSERRTAALQGVGAITHAETRERALAATLRRFPQVSSLFGKNPAVEMRRAFIPGYVFVASDSSKSIAAIKPSQHVAGIESVVAVLSMANGGYCRIPHGVIDALMAAETQGMLEATKKRQNQFKLSFKVGQEVRILGGPFDGLIGKIVRTGRLTRIGVMLEAFGSIDVDADQIESAVG